MSVDVNPLIVAGGVPIAVDGLVEVASESSTPGHAGAGARSARPSTADFAALFEPRGVVVAGASSHPGKFGFVALHNILSQGYAGRGLRDQPRGRRGARRPDGDLARRSSRRRRGRPRLRVHARRREPRAAAGLRAPRDLAPRSSPPPATAKPARPACGPSASWSSLLASSASCSPARTGRASCPRPRACARRSSPRSRPPGRIAIASQSGNFVSSFQNLAVASGVGVSRAVSAGNAAAVTVPDYLEYFAADPETAVALAYVEGIGDGRAFFERLRAVTAVQPLVLLKGGATSGGQRAAASHTGALATDDRVFDGMCRQAGDHPRRRPSRRRSTPPRPSRPSRCPAGHASRCSPPPAAGASSPPTRSPGRSSSCWPCPTTCGPRSTRSCPPRWSRNNPIDLAGAETRDTIPEVLELVARHPDVDAVIYLGLGHPVEPGPADARGARSTPTTGSSGSSRTTSVRTNASRTRRPRCRRRRASRCSRRPSSRSRIPTTPGHAPCATSGRLLLPVVVPRGRRPRTPVALRARPRPRSEPSVEPDPGLRRSCCSIAALGVRVPRGRSPTSGPRPAARARRPRWARRCGRRATRAPAVRRSRRRAEAPGHARPGGGAAPTPASR